MLHQKYEPRIDVFLAILCDTDATDSHFPEDNLNLGVTLFNNAFLPPIRVSKRSVVYPIVSISIRD